MFFVLALTYMKANFQKTMSNYYLFLGAKNHLNALQEHMVASALVQYDSPAYFQKKLTA